MHGYGMGEETVFFVGSRRSVERKVVAAFVYDSILLAVSHRKVMNGRDG
jgi:hypothetical protein